MKQKRHLGFYAPLIAGLILVHPFTASANFPISGQDNEPTPLGVQAQSKAYDIEVACEDGDVTVSLIGEKGHTFASINNESGRVWVGHDGEDGKQEIEYKENKGVYLKGDISVDTTPTQNNRLLTFKKTINELCHAMKNGSSEYELKLHTDSIVKQINVLFKQTGPF